MSCVTPGPSGIETQMLGTRTASPQSPRKRRFVLTRKTSRHELLVAQGHYPFGLDSPQVLNERNKQTACGMFMYIVLHREAGKRPIPQFFLEANLRESSRGSLQLLVIIILFSSFVNKFWGVKSTFWKRNGIR